MFSTNESPFAHLERLVGGYFHQDLDLESSGLEEIIEDFKSCAQPEEIDALKDDIERFLAIEDITLNQPFRDRFRPDVNPCAFRPTTRAFLEAIRDRLH